MDFRLRFPPLYCSYIVLKVVGGIARLETRELRSSFLEGEVDEYLRATYVLQRFVYGAVAT